MEQEHFSDNFDFGEITLPGDSHRAIAEVIEDLVDTTGRMEPSVIRDNLEVAVRRLFETMMASGGGHTSRKETV